MMVHHAHGAYEISFEDLAVAIGRIPVGSFIITDSNVADHWGHAMGAFPQLVLPPGEGAKRLVVVEKCLEWLATQGANRRSTIVAIGGGVIGDLAGFVAAIYMRGVPLWQIPTTLLAQVDSSIGGKVGVDLAGGKNLAGAFHAPRAVSICAETLTTLPKRQLINGFAEIWKYAYIGNLPLLARLRALNGTSVSEPDSDIVRQCIEQKRQIVEADEYETTGLRATLNFGHTVGHAIERVCNYERFLHGEAIALGMVVEAQWGEQLGITATGTADQIAADLARMGLPNEVPTDLRNKALIEAMFADKKRESANRLAASLILEIGTCKLFTDLDPRVLTGIILDL